MYIYYGRGSTNTCQKNYHCSINNITELILTFILAFKIFIAHGRKRKKQKKITQKQGDCSPCHILWKTEQQMLLRHNLNYLILFHRFVVSSAR